MKQRIIRELKKFDLFLRRLNMTLECNKQVNPLYKSATAVLDLNHPSIPEAIKYWRKYNIKLNPQWHAFCASSNNIHSSRYIPEDIFYNYVMPSLNNNNIAWAYNDKNMYDALMQGINMPRTMLRCMHGHLHDADYNLLSVQNYSNSFPDDEVDCFIKPTIDSGKGKNIRKCKIRKGVISIDENRQDVKALIISYKGDFIIQEGITQSPVLSDIYPYSVNTIRSMSLRYENNIVVLSNLLKFGNNGNHVDNTGPGGVVCRIDGEGHVPEFAYDGKFNKIFAHPFTHKPLKNITLPDIGNLEKMIIQAHECLPHFDLVAWDIGVDRFNDYILVEYNLLFPGLNFHQVINGPIFERYLDGILDNLREPEYL